MAVKMTKGTLGLGFADNVKVLQNFGDTFSGGMLEPKDWG